MDGVSMAGDVYVAVKDREPPKQNPIMKAITPAGIIAFVKRVLGRGSDEEFVRRMSVDVDLPRAGERDPFSGELKVPQFRLDLIGDLD